MSTNLYVPTAHSNTSFNFNITPTTTSRRQSCQSGTAIKKPVRKFSTDIKHHELNRKMILDASLQDGAVSEFLNGTSKTNVN